MPELVIPDMPHGYQTVVNFVQEHGKPVAPRGQRTVEVLDTVIVLENPWLALPLGNGRKLNTGIAAMEALQLIGGVSYPQTQVEISKPFRNFRDGEAFHGAYGPRVRPQLEAVVHRLEADRDTREAVITIWDPLRDLMQEGLHDYPCTVMLQFLIRAGRLCMHTTMRSNDVWLGLAYDAFQFTQLQLTIANYLGVPAGPYRHHAVSLHLYERDFAAAARLHTPQPAERDLLLLPNGVHGETVPKIMRRASGLIDGSELPVGLEYWYVDQLARRLVRRLPRLQVAA